jgi:hypothetical protein
MSCIYTYQGKTYSVIEFDDMLRSMEPVEAAKYMTGIKPVPNAPFISSNTGKATNAYITLLMKKAISMAVDEGKSFVAWTTGSQQSDFYDLSKQIKSIDHSSPHNNGNRDFQIHMLNDDQIRFTADKDGLVVKTDYPQLNDQNIEAIVGKELAKQILENPKAGKISGEGLKLDAPWTAAMYGDENGNDAQGKPAIVTQAAREIVRKMGGKIVSVEINDVKQPALIITPEMAAKVRDEGMPLFQSEDEPSKASSQGYVDLNVPGIRNIVLNPTANLSTFMHELNHTWTEELQRDALGENSTEALKKDWETLVKWTAISDPSASIPREAHEQIARGFESYLLEGKAPSIELKKIFRRIKAWMLSVYESLKKFNQEHGIELNDEVRAVFDRLLATNAQIASVRAMNGYTRMFSTPEQAGMTESEFKHYSASIQDNIQEGQEKLIAATMKNLGRQQKREWRDNKAAVLVEMEAQALTVKEYAAMDILSNGKLNIGALEGVRLNKQAAIDLISDIGTINPEVFAETGGVHPDTVAKQLGFRSGLKMLEDFAKASTYKDYVNQLTDNAMKERYGDPMDAVELRESAEKEVHSEKQAQLLEIELRALKRKKAQVEKITKPIAADTARSEREARRNAPVPIAIIKDIAEKEIGEVKWGDLKPDSYLLAEVRAGRRAVDFAANKNYGKAAEAKQQQIVNLYLYKTAREAKAEVEKRLRAVKALTSKKVRAKIGLAGQEWLEQLDDIINSYSFASLPFTQRARRITDFAQSVEEQTGEIIAIAPSIMDEGSRKNFKELTIDELRAVSDTLESIKHIANKITSVNIDGKKVMMADITLRLVESAYKNIKTKPLPVTEADYSQTEQAQNLAKNFLNTEWRPEKIIERLDGDKEGIWHDVFWNPSSDAQNLRDDLQYMVMKPLVELQEKISKEFNESMKQPLEIESMDKVITRRTAIGIILNIGNASNQVKLQRGGMWFGTEHMEVTDAMLEEIKDKLTAEDWQMVQTMWDAIAQLYPYLNDLNKRAVGLPLKAVEPKEITTKFGTMKGGYWPAVGDPRHSKVGELQENSEGTSLSTLFAPKYAKAATSHSFREERTGAVYPIQLDWQKVIGSHINKAVTDIAYHEWVKQSQRILDGQEVRKALQNTVGEEVYRSFTDWLKHQVAPIHGGYSASQSPTTIMNAALNNTVIAALGFRAATAIGNIVVSPIQASHQIKSSFMIKGIAKYLASPKKTTEAVHALSGEMKHRFEHYDQTFNLVIDQLANKTTLSANIARAAMAIHLYADRVSSTALWVGKYNQELAANPDEKRAARLADKMIRTTQTAGAPKDLSAFERDPRYRIFKMFIGPMIVMHNEQRGALAEAGGLKSALTDRKFWGVMMATWIIPSMLFELAVGRGPDDDEEWWEWALRKTLLYQAQQVPLVRDAASTIEGLVTGRPVTARSNPFSDVVSNAIIQSSRALKDDASAKNITEATTRAIGPLLGLPSNQAITVEEYLFDVYEGEYSAANVHRLIYKQKEKR